MSKHTVDACSGAMGCERDVPKIKMKRTAFQVAIEDVWIMPFQERESMAGLLLHPGSNVKAVHVWM
jgi:hypothetical protein